MSLTRKTLIIATTTHALTAEIILKAVSFFIILRTLHKSPTLTKAIPKITVNHGLIGVAYACNGENVKRSDAPKKSNAITLPNTTALFLSSLEGVCALPPVAWVRNINRNAAGIIKQVLKNFMVDAMPTASLPQKPAASLTAPV